MQSKLVEPTVPISGSLDISHKQWQEDGTYIEKKYFIKNLQTTAGLDFIHAQYLTNTAVGTRGAGFIAVSADPTNPVIGDTSLAAEITTGGLARVDATVKTHVSGTNVTLLETIFTATATHIAVHKAGLFNAASGGIMPHSTAFPVDITLALNDIITLSWTVTVG